MNESEGGMNVADYIVELNMDGMEGRMLRLPAPKNKTREILLVYGSHSSIERMAGIAEDLNKYGAVTLPDLPGFGGMDSFYKIDQKPTLDNLADYMAAFVKMRYRRRRVTIMAMSLGFVIITRMLQRHPDLVKKVDLLISFVGFTHHEEFKFRRHNYLLMRWGASIFSRRIPAWVVQNIFLHGPFIRMAYGLAKDHAKLADANAEERRKRLDFEVDLWQKNDFRTYCDTSITMFTLNLCNQRIDLPIWNVTVDADQYFDNHIVEQHMAVIFKEAHMIKTKLGAHAPTVLATAKEAAPFIPAKIRKLLK